MRNLPRSTNPLPEVYPALDRGTGNNRRVQATTTDICRLAAPPVPNDDTALRHGLFVHSPVTSARVRGVMTQFFSPRVTPTNPR